MINDAVKSGFKPQTPVRESAPVSAVASVVSAPVGVETEPEPVATATAEAPPQAELETAVSKLNDYVQNIRRTLSFSIEESTGRTIISVYDAETDELIRQIPPEDALKLAEMINQQHAGMLFEERA